MQPPDFSAEQIRLFGSVLRLFNECGLPYAVSGALALHEHTGIWRITKDLDLFLPPDFLRAGLEVLREEGLETEVLDSVWIGKARQNGHLIDLITGMSNGAISVDTSWIERSLESWLFGIRTRVLALEELIASKVFIARRERFDGADVCHLVYASRGAVDWDRVFALVSQKGKDQAQILLWHLVLYSYVYPAYLDYVPTAVWDTLLGALRGQVDHPDRASRFRGTLIDERMFNVDVADWGLPDMGAELRREKRAEVKRMGDAAPPGPPPRMRLQVRSPVPAPEVLVSAPRPPRP